MPRLPRAAVLQRRLAHADHHPCSSLGSTSAGRHQMSLTKYVNSRFRIAAEYIHSSKDNTNLSTWGAWQYFTVRQ